MKIFAKVMKPKNIKSFLLDMLTGVSSVSESFCEIVISECDICFQEYYIPNFMGGYWADYPAVLVICPRNQEVFDQMAKLWHEIINQLLPNRTQEVDYLAFQSACKAAGYDEARIRDKIMGFSQIKELFEQLSGESPLAKTVDIQIEEFEVYSEYKRSLFRDKFDKYPTFDLWSPQQMESYIASRSFEKVYYLLIPQSEEFGESDIKLTPTTPEKPVKHPVFNWNTDITPKEYQDWHLGAKEDGIVEKREAEQQLQIKNKIDYSLIPSSEDVLLGKWIPTPNDITQSYRISNFLNFPSEYKKLKRFDIGKPALWKPIWLFFNSNGEQEPLDVLGHDLLNEIAYRVGNGVMCWLFEIASHYIPWRYNDPDLKSSCSNEKRKKLVRESIQKNKRFPHALKNLRLHGFITIEEIGEDSYGIINISITDAGLNAAIIEAEKMPKKSQSERVSLDCLVSNSVKVRDWYILRGINWKWLYGFGWHISQECESKAIELGLKQYLEIGEDFTQKGQAL